MRVKRSLENLLHPIGRPWVIAHRGYWSRGGIENTIDAFLRAVETGCEMIELDLRQTADGKIVVFHDAKLENKLLSEMDSKNLQDIAYEKGIDVPFFEDVLEALAGKIMIDIEIKDPGIEKEVLLQTSAIMPGRTYLISSYDISILKKIRKLDSSVQIGWVVGERNYIIFKILKMFTFFRATIWNWINYLIPEYKYVDSKLVNTCQNLGIELLCWTVNSSQEMIRLSNLNIAGIITDEPEECLRLISRHMALSRKEEKVKK